MTSENLQYKQTMESLRHRLMEHHDRYYELTNNDGDLSPLDIGVTIDGETYNVWFNIEVGSHLVDMVDEQINLVTTHEDKMVEKLLYCLKYIEDINCDVIEDNGEIIPNVTVDDLNDLRQLIKTMLVD